MIAKTINDLIKDDTINESISSSERLMRFNLIYYLQKHFNFRFADIKIINYNQLLYDYYISFLISKSKHYIVIRDEFAWKFLNTYFSSNNYSDLITSYKQYLTFIKYYHPEMIIKSKKINNHITHSFRYLNVKNVNNLRKNKNINAEILHHKSLKSQSYYLNNVI